MAVKKLQYNRYAAFELQKVLMASHPSASFVRVNWGAQGFVAEVEESGVRIDVSSEMVAFVNRKLLENGEEPMRPRPAPTSQTESG